MATERIIDQAIREKILSIKDLYTLPQTLVEVLRVTDNPQTSAYDLSKIILRDAPITARLLKMANSALYGRSGSVNTVHQAVILLGFRSVKSLVLSTSVYDVFGDGAAREMIDVNEFWRHALETAGISQLLASRAGFQPQEEAFVAGLLHDLGHLMMVRIFSDEYGKFVSSSSDVVDWCKAERETFGIDHTEAAEILLTAWGLPDQIVRPAVEHHRALQDSPGTSADRLSLIVALADRLGHQGVENRPTLTREQVEAKHRVVAALGLQPIDLVSVDRWVSENLAAMATHLEMEIGSPAEILSRANVRLYELYAEMEALLLKTPSAHSDEFAQQILDAICATFSHYINNATTTIMGHSELVELCVRKGQIPDDEGRLVESMRMIERAVLNISAVLTEMKNLREFDVISYHDRAKILNIEDKVKERLEVLLNG